MTSLPYCLTQLFVVIVLFRDYLVLLELPETPAKMVNLVYKVLLVFPVQAAHAESVASLANVDLLVHQDLLENVALSE